MLRFHHTAMLRPATPPLSSCTEDTALAFPSKPLQPLSSARQSYSVRSSGVSYTSPPRSLLGAGVLDRARQPTPKAPPPVRRSSLTSRWVTNRSPWMDTCPLPRLTHAHLRTRVLGGVLADEARVRHSVCSCLGYPYIVSS